MPANGSPPPCNDASASGVGRRSGRRTAVLVLTLAPVRVPVLAMGPAISLTLVPALLSVMAVFLVLARELRSCAWCSTCLRPDASLSCRPLLSPLP